MGAEMRSALPSLSRLFIGVNPNDLKRRLLLTELGFDVFRHMAVWIKTIRKLLLFSAVDKTCRALVLAVFKDWFGNWFNWTQVCLLPVHGLYSTFFDLLCIVTTVI